MTKIVLIPAFQPDNKLLELIDILLVKHFQVVVVNDGSGTAYKHIFDNIADRATLLTHKQNRGKGAAIKTGLDYIINNTGKPYVVVTADADGQHKPDDILRVANEAASAPSSLILGSRKLNRQVPLRSRFGNAITRNVFRLSTGNSIYDTQTGLRGFTHEIIQDMLTVSGERYEYEMNVLIEFSMKKIPIKEITIETVYIDNNSSSHFNVVKDSMRIYREIIKFSASSLLSFGIDYLLFCLLNIITNITAANILARICSAGFNYTVNRKLVFHSRQSVASSLPKYIALAVFILLCNTLILNLLAYIGINIYFSKILSEIIMFVLSYTIQHIFIFNKPMNTD